MGKWVWGCAEMSFGDLNARCDSNPDIIPDNH